MKRDRSKLTKPDGRIIPMIMLKRCLLVVTLLLGDCGEKTIVPPISVTNSTITSVLEGYSLAIILNLP